MNPIISILIYVIFFFLSIPSASHAAEWILYNSGRFDTLENFSLNAVSFDGAQQIKIQDGPFLNPKVSPEGSVMFLSVPEWRDKFVFMMIYSFSLNGQFLPYRITPLMGWDGNPDNTTHVLWTGAPTLSPDLSQIIYHANLLKWEDSTQPKFLTQGLKVAPDSNDINIHPQAIDPTAYLAIARTDGTDANNAIAIDLPGQAMGYSWTQPDWHPIDRQKIAVSFLNDYPGYQDFTIYITNPEGTSIHSLLNPVNNPFIIERHRSPVWSPDGNSIAYVRQVGNEYAVFIVRADGADSPGTQITPTNIVNIPPIQDIGAYFFDAIKEICWSPDGNYLSFSVFSHAAMQSPMGYDIYSVKKDGTQLTRLTSEGNCAYPEWFSAPNLPNSAIFVLPNSTPVATATIIQPSNTPTPVAPTNTPTTPPIQSPTPTPNVVQPTTPNIPSFLPIIKYDFSESTFDETGWSIIDGGFVPNTPAGTIKTTNLNQLFNTSFDNQGLELTVAPNQVAFMYSSTPVNTNGNPVIIRMTILSTSANATVTLGALKGSIGQLDGSLAYQMPMTAQSFVNQESTMSILYEPDEGKLITPIVQVVSTTQNETISVLVDRVEITVLESDKVYKYSLIH